MRLAGYSTATPGFGSHSYPTYPQRITADEEAIIVEFCGGYDIVLRVRRQFHMLDLIGAELRSQLILDLNLQLHMIIDAKHVASIKSNCSHLRNANS